MTSKACDYQLIPAKAPHFALIACISSFLPLTYSSFEKYWGSRRNMNISIELKLVRLFRFIFPTQCHQRSLMILRSAAAVRGFNSYIYAMKYNQLRK